MDKEALAEAFAQVDPTGQGEITFSQFQLLITNLLQ
jgi:Ca2+-binding EF-hand superfamily protein